MNENFHSGEIAPNDMQETSPQLKEGFDEIKPQVELSSADLDNVVYDEVDNYIEESSEANPDAGQGRSENLDSRNEAFDEEEMKSAIDHPEQTSQEERKILDDDGNLFLEGDSLIPNNEFTANGYTFRTDDEGRIISADVVLETPPPFKLKEGFDEIKPQVELSSADLDNAVYEEIDNYIEGLSGGNPDAGQSRSEKLDSRNEAFDEEEMKTATDHPEQTSQEGREYLDDNGNPFREGDSLIPNNEFTINGYTYRTDDEGRVISAEGDLKLPEGEYKRNMEETRTIEGQDYGPNDERGHLIGHQFGGSDNLENLLPMDTSLNRGDYKRMENTLRDALKNGSEVHLDIFVTRGEDSNRPTGFRVTTTIDGERKDYVFSNEGSIAA